MRILICIEEKERRFPLLFPVLDSNDGNMDIDAFPESCKLFFLSRVNRSIY